MKLRGWTTSPSKILGVAFDSECDYLTLPLTRSSLETGKATRGGVLSYTFSLFDPCGLRLSWTIRLRSLLQTSWKAQLGWDDCFPSELEEIWQDLKREAFQNSSF